MNRTGSTIREVATFWHGSKLAALDKACLASFGSYGFDVMVYSYGDIGELPTGVRGADARLIANESLTKGFRIGGKPSLSHFSDLFRYKMFAATGQAWIDTDLVCLSAFAIPQAGNYYGLERPDSINGAIMRIDPREAKLNKLIKIASEYALAENFQWGATGPRLITKTFGSGSLSDARPSHLFYPIDWTDWWKPFLPEERDWCADRCSSSDALHLWNNIVEKGGYWKELAPPAGSFLSEKFRELDLLSLFTAVMPPDVMRRLVALDQHLRFGTHHRLTQILKIAGIRGGQILRNRVHKATGL